MPKLYQTDDMEAAVHHMAATNHRVIVYWRYASVRPIRMQLDKVRDLKVEQCFSWKPTAQAAIDRWQERGGILIWRPHPMWTSQVMPECDALLFIEAPMQLGKFESLVKLARQEVVVYRPPTWDMHNKSMEHFYPGKHAYSMLDAIAGALVGRDLTEVMLGALEASGMPPETTAVFTAWDIAQMTCWTERKLKRILLHKYRYSSQRWHIYKLRIPPRGADMLWAYNIIAAQPQVAVKMHALRTAKPAGPALIGFKPMLTRLEKEHYVVREDSIYLMNTAYPPLDYDMIDAQANVHHGRWFAMKALIDNLEEYPL